MLAASLALLLALGAPCVEVLSLSDLHGRVGALPGLAAAVAPVRARGPSLLLDAGDSAQGTLEATLTRGRAAVDGLAALGVNAAALGNHDLDFGQAAARERIAAAPYPTLAANVRDAATGRLPAWPNLAASRIFRLPGGPVVGVVGLATPSTPRQTMPANVAGLRFGKLAPVAEREARALRARGADIVVALVHAGGGCREAGVPDDLSTCDPRGETFALARALPPGLVDAIVGGHTHAFTSHRVNGAAVLQAGAKGEAVGWVTLCVGEPARFHLPVRAGGGKAGGAAASDPAVAAAVAPALSLARAERERPVGVTLARPLGRGRDRVSPLGATAAQAARAAMGAEVGLVNAGALRSSLPAGELRYGQLYEALPFDDGLAVVRLTGADLLAVLRALASFRRETPQVAGVVFDGASARTCAGEPLDPARTYTVAMNEFLAEGGDGVRGILSRLPPGAKTVRGDLRLRDATLAWLRTAPESARGKACP
ncbi:MAG TPA: 5'-nucleotidase C-terminal domain-containing protein [Anaeromyxobacteraceae bacterium]|nr:5'-nucleotidase C-terminal domain-containing protein [Anaeromyxobacteraceae bacterium]